MDKILWTASLFFITLNSSAQIDSLITEERSQRVVFWNVENLFDTQDDSLTRDESFTPQGDNHWNYTKYQTKLERLSKVVMAAGGFGFVDIISFAEVENKRVLEDLLTETPLKNSPYYILHQDSPDKRGIDVGLLFNQETVTPIKTEWITVDLPTGKTTRQIMHLTYLIKSSADTNHLFINHWPSRYGGYMATVASRDAACAQLALAMESIPSHHNIIALGDFNEDPDGQSMACIENLLVYQPPLSETAKGTHKYQNHWGYLDHIWINSYLNTQETTVFLLEFPFLFVKDEKYGGIKVNRTFSGPKYLGGYSDHLPICIDLH